MAPDFYQKNSNGRNNGNNRNPKNSHNNGRNNGYYKKQDNGQKSERSYDAPKMVTAPYNFVSLPSDVVPAPFVDTSEQINDQNLEEKYIQDVKENENNTGFLELEIKTLTPCFINSFDNDQKNDEKAFFKIGDYYMIAGSSLRGMVKNIFKIISGGAMRPNEDLDDAKLYFRQVAGVSDVSLKGFYDSELENVEPGFLIQVKNGKYYICPGHYPVSSKDGKKPDGRIYTKDAAYLRGPKFIWNDDEKVVDCVSGHFFNKNHFIRIVADKFDERIEVPEDIILAYEGDRQRDKKINILDFGDAKRDKAARLFTNQEDVVYVVPCFYTADEEKVKTFGHCSKYRIPYEHSIGEFVPTKLRNCLADLTDAVFGKKDFWASRLYFEDAVVDKSNGEPQEYEAAMHWPLLKPNPTSYQLYLKQPSDAAQKNQSAPNHWGTSPKKTSIRGYKFYWHNSYEKAWEKRGNGPVVEGMKKISPLKPGTVFRGRIRFQHLSDIELGALCAVFRLGKENQDIAYKIGQGKSIGMGSIKINTSLFLENNQSSDIRLFADGNQGWYSGLERCDMEKYITEFTNYRDEHLQNKPAFDISQQELFALLDYNVTEQYNWGKKISVMSATKKGDNRFKDHKILSETLEFVKQKFE